MNRNVTIAPGPTLRAHVAHAPSTQPATFTLAATIVALALVAASPRSPRAQTTEPLAQDRPPPADVTAADLMRSMPSDVRIIARDNHDIEEYRSGNNLYMVKVKPRNAPPYYLIDQDGSGELQWRRGSELESTVVPQWAIVRW